MRTVLLSLVLACLQANDRPIAPDDVHEVAKPAQRGDGMEFRSVPVGDLTAARRTAELPRLGRVLADRAWGPESTWILDQRDADLTSRMWFPKIDHKLDLEKLTALHDPVWGNEGTFSVNGDHVVAVNRGPVLDRLEKTVARLRAIHAARYRFEYAVLEDGSIPAGSAAESAASLTDDVMSGKRGSLLDHGTVVASVGDQVRVGTEQLTALQVEFDVEIAQDASALEPIIENLSLGRSLTLHPMHDVRGRLVLCGMYSDRRLSGAPETASLGLTETRTIERAPIAQTQLAFSARASRSGVVVLAPGGTSRPDLRVVIRATRLDSPPNDVDGHVAIPVATLIDPTLTATNKLLSPLAAFDRREIRRMVQGFCESGPAEASVKVHGDVLYVAAPAAQTKGVRGLVEYLARGASRQFVVTLTREVRAADGSLRPIGKPVAIPCMAGRVGFALDGTERLIVSGYDVEVAQKSEVADPIVTACFDGLQAFVRVAPQGEQCGVSLRLIDRSVLNVRQITQPAKLLGMIEVPNQAVARFDRELSLKPGESRVLGSTASRSVGGSPRPVQLRVKLEEITR